MPSELEAPQGNYAYMTIAEDIAARVKSGELRLHARLLSEKKLAAHYQVAHMTVRQALAELRRRNVVYTLPAKGTFVR